MIVMDDIKDEWKLEGNYLTRKHYVPRNSDFQLTEDNCPLPLNYFTKDRYTKMGTSLVRDRWTRTHGQQEAELQVLDRLYALQAGTFLAQDSSEALHGEERREGDHVLQRGQCQQPDHQQCAGD